MYICICKNLTDGEIRKAVHEKGVCNLRSLRKALGVCDQCGKCAREAQQIIQDTQKEKCPTFYDTALAQ